MNNQEKYQLWLNQYKATKSSGLSIKRWAIQNNLFPSTVHSRIYSLVLDLERFKELFPKPNPTSLTENFLMYLLTENISETIKMYRDK